MRSKSVCFVLGSVLLLSGQVLADEVFLAKTRLSAVRLARP